jgi:PTH1 family peptidyl-tRNA hydrolase
MKLIVGLGNPGPEYDNTRHNVGFVVLDRLARRHAPPHGGSTAKAKFHGSLLEGSIDDEKVLLLKPLTFMNRSGLAVSEAVSFYKIDVANDLLVIVDDVALPCGSIRLRSEGSAGGHNGLGDIEQKLGTSNYCRLRIGIDQPGQIPQKDYVLGRFRPDQQQALEPALEESVKAAECWSDRGINEAMNRFNTRRPPTTPATAVAEK